MKKFILLLFTLLLLTALNLSALDIMTGVKTGYYLWRPFYKDFTQSGTGDISIGNGMLYGPVISVIINPKWSISFSGLMGTQSSAWSLEEGKMDWGPDKIIANSTWYADTKRVDLDFAISNRLSNNLRIFVGYKYQYMETEYQATFIGEDTSDGDQYAVDGIAVLKSPAHGPAIGAGYSILIADNMFFSTNLSFLYMFSYVEWAKSKWNNYQPDGPDSFSLISMSQDNFKLDTYQIGINFEPSFGVKVNNKLFLTLGGRFQWMYVNFIDDPILDGARIAPDDGLNDLIYGGFLSVIYSF